MSKPAETFDAIVLGAGAAGLMCALTAGKRGRKVLLLEHTDKVGAKILISGGGRCNFTNHQCTPNNFISLNPQFSRSALSGYTPSDFIALVTRHGIAFHEKTLGQLFCDGSARAIVSMLRHECASGHVDIRVDHTITNVTRADRFTVATSHGSFTAPSLVLATGGLSIPKMGATGLALDLALKFGLRLTEILPGLVPLKMDTDPDLSGVSVAAQASLAGHRFRENVLFTHHGLSGPAILQISSYWRPGQTISLDLAPDLDASQVLQLRKRARPKAQPQTVLGEILPARLANALSAQHLPGLELANIPDRTLADFGRVLNAWPVKPLGTLGYAKAEVTVGGIDTRDLSSKTMEARTVPGLYCIGEAVDVTGWLGGYNFQWAWSSAVAAGRAL